MLPIQADLYRIKKRGLLAARDAMHETDPIH